MKTKPRTRGTTRELTDALVRIKDGKATIYSWHTSPGAARTAKWEAFKEDRNIILVRMDTPTAQRAVGDAPAD